MTPCKFQSLRRDSSSGRDAAGKQRTELSVFQSLRRDSSSGRLFWSTKKLAPILCFNLSGEIPQVAAFLIDRYRQRSKCFNLSGEIPQVAARIIQPDPNPKSMFQSLRRDSSSGRLRRPVSLGIGELRFNLSGEIPQVAAEILWDNILYVNTVSISQARFLKWPLATIPIIPSYVYRFQSLRRDSSSGRQSWRHSMGMLSIVSISQARFLKWPRLSSMRRWAYERCFNLSGEIPQVAARRRTGSL